MDPLTLLHPTKVVAAAALEEHNNNDSSSLPLVHSRLPVVINNNNNNNDHHHHHHHHHPHHGNQHDKIHNNYNVNGSTNGSTNGGDNCGIIRNAVGGGDNNDEHHDEHVPLLQQLSKKTSHYHHYHIMENDNNKKNHIHIHNNNNNNINNLHIATWYLYSSHCIGQLSEQTWQFVIILLLSAISHYQSLIWIASFGLFSGICITICGGSIGYYIDHTSFYRLRTAQWFIGLQNISVLLATLCFYLLLQQTCQYDFDHESNDSSPKATGTTTTTTTTSIQSTFETAAAPDNTVRVAVVVVIGGIPINDIYSICLLIGIHIFGATAQILDRAFLVVIERDWIVVMSETLLQLVPQPQPQQQLPQHHPPEPKKNSETNNMMKHEYAKQNNDDNNNNNSNNHNNDNHENNNDFNRSRSALSSENNNIPPTPEGSSDTCATTAASSATAASAQAAAQQWLSHTNVTLKQIDLACKIIAPAIAGFVVAAFDTNDSTTNNNDSNSTSSRHYDDNNDDDTTTTTTKIRMMNLTSAVVLVGIFNFTSLLVELVCTTRVYHLVPTLATSTSTKTRHNDNITSVTNTITTTTTEPVFPPTETIGNTTKNGNNNNIISHSTVRNVWTWIWNHIVPHSAQVYMSQRPVIYAGFGLALLYLNVLTFGALMTAYLVWRGVRLETVGIWRGISAAIGLAGTLVYEFSVHRTTLIRTGLWSILFQLVCITISLASFFIDDYNTSVSMLVGGVCASRIGLWVFDIAVTQLMQHFIPPNVRGVVGGVQQSLNAFFGTLSFALGLVLPRPSEFVVYVACGYAAVAIAALLFVVKLFPNEEQLMTDFEKNRRSKLST